MIPQEDNVCIHIPGGEYENFKKQPEYIAKKEADRVSYKWDSLINLFTTHILGGTSASIFGEEPEPALAEKALRFLALETRLSRRVLGLCFANFLQQARESKSIRYARVIFPASQNLNKDLAYLFLILAYEKSNGSYEEYRKFRFHMLEAYCLAAMFDNRTLRTVVGVALDAPPEVTGRPGGSEEITAIEIHEWTRELEQQVIAARKHYDILNPELLKVYGLNA